MEEMQELLKPTWGAEKWISEGWQKITPAEKDLISARMDDLFKDGLPFELRHDRIIYIHVFSLLAQLEVLAVQIPLRFEDKMSNPQFKQQMRRQLLDEIFHGLVFTKIVYLLCMPYSYPPEYNQDIEELCNFIRTEECPKTGIVLLNLVAEGWIEELFIFFYKENIAPKVFKTILEDEHRHVCEADLYKDIGLPSKNILEEKLQNLEQIMGNALLSQPKYLMAISQLFGKDKVYALTQMINNKHIKQLKKIKMKPSKNWQNFMQINEFSKNFKTESKKEEIELSPLKQVYLTQWDKPGDPTMVGHFDVDVTCLKLSAKVYPRSMLNTLSLQAVSKMLSENPELRTYLNYFKRIRDNSANVALVVKLPECGDHLGNILFKDCHKIPTAVLTNKINQAINFMTICFKMREQIELANPKLKYRLEKVFREYSDDFYPYPIPATNYISVSNIGFCGYNQAKSPLLKGEALKFVLLAVEKKPVWNEELQNFQPRDILPVSASGDHRVIDGNVMVPKEFRTAFNLMYEKMLTEPKTAKSNDNLFDLSPILLAKIEDIVYENLELGYRLLYTLQTTWFDYINIDKLVELSAAVL